MRLVLGENSPEIVKQIQHLFAGNFELAAVAENGDALFAAVHAHNPDVVVTDLNMPVMNGIEATRKIIAAGFRARMIIMSVEDSPEVVLAALCAGAVGYVLKEDAAEDLLPAVVAVAAGRTFISPKLAGRIKHTL